MLGSITVRRRGVRLAAAMLCQSRRAKSSSSTLRTSMVSSSSPIGAGGITTLLKAAHSCTDAPAAKDMLTRMSMAGLTGAITAGGLDVALHTDQREYSSTAMHHASSSRSSARGQRGGRGRGSWDSRVPPSAVPRARSLSETRQTHSHSLRDRPSRRHPRKGETKPPVSHDAREVQEEAAEEQTMENLYGDLHADAAPYEEEDGGMNCQPESEADASSVRQEESPQGVKRSSLDGQEEPGWGLERVNTNTGKTALEDLYQRHLSSIHDILARPLPPLPQDGSVDPDFFVGFVSYSYQLRDQYRAVLARELQVPVRAIRLSIAWSGRFNVKRFGRVQKVCGVCLDRSVLQGSEGEGNEHRATPTTSSSSAPSEAEGQALPLELQQRIRSLIADINSQKREDLLQVQLFQASPPLPEVEFALTRREHQVLFHLFAWIRQHFLQRALVVVVYGLPPSPPPSKVTSEMDSTSATPTETLATAEVRDRYAAWRQKSGLVCATQQSEMEQRWIRLFHRRNIVPSVFSLTELATEVAVAVVRGEVPRVCCEIAKLSSAKVEEVAGEKVEAVSLDAELSAVLQRMAVVATGESPAVQKSGGGVDHHEGAAADPNAAAPSSESSKLVVKDVLRASTNQDNANAPQQLDLITSTEQSAALRWVRLVFDALLLREAHSSGAGNTASAAVSYSLSEDVTLPALFAHGVYAGGRDEVAYLQHNAAALKALLLHPHEITFKKKFVSRMQNGHRKLRMEAEATAPHSME